MAEVVGLTKAKINGKFYVDVKGARWSIKRPVNKTVTQGGVKSSKGVGIPEGSFDEVIDNNRAVDWKSLSNFSIEIFSNDGNNTLVFSATGCDWMNVDGQTDLAQGTAGRSIGWKGEEGVEF